MEISVRSATTSDIDVMTGLLADLFSIEKDFKPELQRQTKGLTMMLSGSEERIVLVAEVDKKVIGMVTGQLLVSTAEGGIVALVEDLTVSPEYRGSGVGANLLAEVESWARSLGSTRIQLLTDKDNAPAKEFYKKADWSLTNLVCLRKIKPGTKLCPGMKTQEEKHHA